VSHNLCVGKASQLTFNDLRMKSGRGGPRPGAGRPAAKRPVIHHVKREEVSEREPAHVTLRVVASVPSLRRKPFIRAFQRSLREVKGRTDFRVVEYSIQVDHVHIIVEASDKEALACGMKAVGSRLARAVHRVFARTGRVQVPPVRIDAASSGRLFGGWRRGAPVDTLVPGLREVSTAESWLLRTGWKKCGLIDPAEVPGGRKRRAA